MTRPLMWLSFVDGARPEGERFLGVAIVPGTDPISAVKAAWDLGCNPGGEVLVASLFPELIPDESWIGRLLTRDEAEALNAFMASIVSLRERGTQ